MKGVNIVILEGVISEHLDIRYFDYEHLRVKFQLETREKGLKADGSDWVQWHSIELTNAAAKQAESQLKQGDSIRIEGRIAYHKDFDKEGRKRYVTLIHAHTFTLLNEAETLNLKEDAEVQSGNQEELEWEDFSASSDEDPMA